VEGADYRAIARRFGLSKDAVRRHNDEHIPAALTRAKRAQEVTDADTLLVELAALKSKAVALLRQAEAAGDVKTALAGVREAARIVEVLLEVAGRLNRQPQVTLLLSSEWLHTQAALVQALAPYPDARVAAADALTRLGASDVVA
jgi:hypothetical protein